ncbi:hypothetical protein FQN60_006828 [Etheostoma spectabile]|uniref:Uncharacterized protein n=1 Tax=Etheostoma spectabile TaxID=54343 RepID=A0A5J5CFC9_9PERO|nr:hypothetical protein FQN60_006828 [Etheostoma spectabile]
MSNSHVCDRLLSFSPSPLLFSLLLYSSLTESAALLLALPIVNFTTPLMSTLVFFRADGGARQEGLSVQSPKGGLVNVDRHLTLEGCGPGLSHLHVLQLLDHYKGLGCTERKDSHGALILHRHLLDHQFVGAAVDQDLHSIRGSQLLPALVPGGAGAGRGDGAFEDHSVFLQGGSITQGFYNGNGEF